MKVRLIVEYNDGQISSNVVDHNHFGVGNYTTMLRIGANMIPFDLIKQIVIVPVLDLPTNVGRVDEAATAMLPTQLQQGS